MEYARQLVHLGCRLLVLTSRTGTLPASVSCEFAAAGCRVVVLKADASNEEDMKRVITHIRENLPHIQHYAHAAGGSGFEMLQDITPEAFWNVANTKVVGASIAAHGGLALESQVMFSSTSAVWSQTGASHYAAANLFLDSLASHQQVVGYPATSLQLGPFAEAGMAAGHVADLEAIGLKGMHPTQLQDAVLATGGAPSMVYARIDAQKFTQLYTAKGRWSLLDAALKVAPGSSAVVGEQNQIETSLPSTGITSVGQISQIQGTKSSNVTIQSVGDIIKKVATDVLGDVASDDFDDFPAGGFDSLSAVELSSTVGTSLGISLPATLVYDYPSVSAMASHIHSLLAPPEQMNAGNNGGGSTAQTATFLGPLALLRPSMASAVSNSEVQMLEVRLAAKVPQPITSGVYNTTCAGGLGADAISVVPYGRWNLETLRVSPFYLNFLPLTYT